MIRVIGIGSPFGADAIGWRAIERLRASSAAARWGARVQLSALDRPGAALLAHWRGAQQVILIDAMRSGAAPGTVRRFAAHELAQARSLRSTHGFGVREVLALAEVLGERPANLILFGVEIEPDGALAEEAALTALVDTVRAEIEGALGVAYA